MIPKKTHRIGRPQITEKEIEAGLKFLNKRYERARKRKGHASFASIHEILGKVTEEYLETCEAVHHGDKKATELELADVAIACLWGIISLKAKKTD